MLPNPSLWVIWHTVFVWSLCCIVCAAAVASPATLNPGVYLITAETLLPHLEENLRYATIRSNQCLGTQDAATLFPILRHQAFAGCELAATRSSGERSEFSLGCKNPEAATGTAYLVASPSAVFGLLEIKMGAKNMTLSQRISGPRVGACEATR
jgi:hypothetical protein